MAKARKELEEKTNSRYNSLKKRRKDNKRKCLKEKRKKIHQNIIRMRKRKRKKNCWLVSLDGEWKNGRKEEWKKDLRKSKIRGEESLRRDWRKRRSEEKCNPLRPRVNLICRSVHRAPSTSSWLLFSYYRPSFPSDTYAADGSGCHPSGTHLNFDRHERMWPAWWRWSSSSTLHLIISSLYCFQNHIFIARLRLKASYYWRAEQLFPIPQFDSFQTAVRQPCSVYHFMVSIFQFISALACVCYTLLRVRSAYCSSTLKCFTRRSFRRVNF